MESLSSLLLASAEEELFLSKGLCSEVLASNADVWSGPFSASPMGRCSSVSFQVGMVCAADAMLGPMLLRLRFVRRSVHPAAARAAACAD